MILRRTELLGSLFRNFARRNLCSAQDKLGDPDFKTIVNKTKVVVFMKGNPESPRCGFSNAVVQLLNMHGVQFDSYDVLSDDSLREGVKKFTNWPTIPQVFINGEFVGGCDIMLQMHQNGSLVEELRKAGIESCLEKK